jgi:hypothetical protein
MYRTVVWVGNNLSIGLPPTRASLCPSMELARRLPLVYARLSHYPYKIRSPPFVLHRLLLVRLVLYQPMLLYIMAPAWRREGKATASCGFHTVPGETVTADVCTSIQGATFVILQLSLFLRTKLARRLLTLRNCRGK